MQQKDFKIQCMWTGVMLAALAFMTVYLYNNQQQVKQFERIKQTVVVETMTMESKSNQPDLSVYGFVVVPKALEIRSPLLGDVEKIEVGPGQRVAKGQTLVSIDKSEYDRKYRESQAEYQSVLAQIKGEKTASRINQAALEQEKSLTKLSKKRYDRQKKLVSEGAVAQIVLENSEKEYKMHQLELNKRQALLAKHESSIEILKATQKTMAIRVERTKEDLKKTNIVSPVDGIISDVNISLGGRIDSQSLIKIIPDGQYEIRAQIPSNHIQSIKDKLASGEPLLSNIILESSKIPVRLNNLLPVVQDGQMGQQGVFTFVNQSDSELFAHKMPVLMRMSLPEVENSYLISQSSLYPDNTVYVMDESQRLKAVKVERTGFSYQNDEPMLIITASESLDQQEIMVTHIPNPTSGLSVEKFDDNG